MAWLRFLMAAAVTLSLAATARADKITTINMSYACTWRDIPSRLQVEVILSERTSPVGGFRNNFIWGVLFTPGERVMYGGFWTSDHATLAFAGELNYAEMVNMQTGDMFRVRFDPRGEDRLNMVVAPFRPESYTVVCKLEEMDAR